ncbi:APC family permease [Pseudomonas viridiflava]|uniref:Amino acid permease n=2 Tax=Pseudomonas syringae group TaxID=136849 RepID=A0A0P9YMJ0_PSESI|nr:MULTISPECIES: APC family permease [Pseudomonas syringae group]EKN44382.1 amino acid permease [Pseudomonas viridiflava UASWS0038]KPL61809.1 amino acid permease [Pseudomonas viridiflava]KPY47102.1 Amino acid permease [Pseudomonas syringae pv. ribicola]OAG92389.1 amino acid permease [Pseudomonas viridiflava]
MASHEKASLRRAITAPMLMLFILGDVLGAGVYALAGTIAGRVGGAIWAPLLIALCFALLTAASYAELVTKYPRAGGAAVYAEKAFGKPLLSFLVGFSMIAAGVTSAAGLAVAFAGDYLQALISVPPQWVCVGFLVIVGLLNARGIKESLGANLLMTTIELSGLVMVIAAAAWFVGQGQGVPQRVFELDTASPATAILAASLLAFYSFVGFETSANLAEEIKDVRKVYPRALFGALLIAGAVYVLVGVGAAMVLPVDQLKDSQAPLLDVVKASGLGIPSTWFALIALIAVANGALLTMIMASRLTFGMAREGLLPAILGSVLPHRRTPGVAILVTTLVAIALSFTSTLTTLAETVVLLLLFVFLSVNVAVLVLKRAKVEPAHFQVHWVIPVLGILSCLLLLTQQGPETWLRAGVMLVVGAVLYGLTRLGRPQAVSHISE